MRNPVLRKELAPHGPDVDRPAVSDVGRRWWDRNRAAIRGGWRDCQAWGELPRADRLLIEERIKHGLGHPDADVRERMRAMVETLAVVELIEDAPPASGHLTLELKAAARRGRPLESGEPVPGCGCETCTRIPPSPPRPARWPNRDTLPALDVDRARAVSIRDVAARLGIEANRAGWALCPFHADSSPSLHLNDRKGAAFCNPCGKSWDPIALVMELRGLTFPDAVRELGG
jgi:hypothetical protein